MSILKSLKSLIKNKSKQKPKVLIKSKFGLPSMRVCSVVLVDGADLTTTVGADTGTSTGDFATGLTSGDFSSSASVAGTAFTSRIGDQIKEIYFRNNQDAKDLIVNFNGVLSISFGKVNEQYEAIRINYSELSLELKTLIKIYSFTTGDKIIFSKDSNQKKEIAEILESMKISIIDIVDLVNFE